MTTRMNSFPSAHRRPAGLMAAALMAVAGITTVHAQATLQAQLAARPLTPGDKTIYKLPATTQVSGGLSTVGLGQPVYLEAQLDISIPASDIAGVTWTLVKKPATSKADLAASPLPPELPIYEPSDRTVFQIAGRKLLRPDVVGRYTVTATISTIKSGSVNLTRTFTGSTYMGIATCAMCHNIGLQGTVWAIVSPWSQTGHASMFKQGVTGLLSDHYGSGCLSCHTVGYDTNPDAVNGGFDDVAAQLKWTFPTALKPATWDSVPPALQNVSNIQCENCHGPGSRHVALGGTLSAISVSRDSGVCAQCHEAPTHHIKSTEWKNAAHAVTTRDPSGPGREGCVGCHTGTGFVDRVNGVKIVNTNYTPINCQTCHEPHGQTVPSTNAHLVRTLGTVTLQDGTNIANAGLGALCMDCHQSRRNAATYASTTTGSAHFGPHSGPQGDMLAGVNGFTYGQSIPSSAHASVVKDTCVGCHMQTVPDTDPAFSLVGGHTFKPSWTDPSTGKRRDIVETCQGCHGPTVTAFDFPLIDYDEDGVTEGVQTEVQHLLDKLAAMLPPVGKAKASLSIDSTWTQPQLEAAYNWLYVQNDGSRGVHNTAYAVGLLKASIKDLSSRTN